jgi:DNA repair exonuclease SbcCD ATPase subunit
MKRVNFKKISIKNFLSFGSEPVELEFNKGLHIITGVNRDKSDRQNGIGKSAMMESLYFAIFGKTLRDIKKDLIPNNYTNGTCEVILHFEVINGDNNVNYKIVRTINPSKLFLYKEGEDVTRDSIKNTEEYLHGLINASESLFENCVIMTVNNMIPFMAKNKIDKRKFIESIFNLDIFSRMLSVVRDEYNESKRFYEIELTKMEGIDNNFKSLKAQKDNILNNRKTKLEVYQNRKVSNIEEKSKLEKDLSKELSSNLDDIKTNISKLKSGKDLLDKKIFGLIESKSDVTSKISLLESNFKKIGTSESKCPVCLRSIEEHDKEMVKSEKSKITEEIKLLKESVIKIETDISDTKQNKKKLETAIDKLNDKVKTFAVDEQKRKSTKERLKQLDIWLSQLDGDIEEMKSIKTDFDDEILNVEKTLIDVKESVNKYRYTMNLLETVKFILAEEGVKSYIVSKILVMFNERIRYYLSRLDANCLCNFNQYFEEEIINEKNKICSYNNFSAAERKTIDMACMFSFIDMRKLQGDVTYNVSIFDELFDSSFDSKGLENITNIIKERVDKYDECIMIISHRKESINEATGDIIFLEKKEGVTKKLDYNPF